MADVSLPPAPPIEGTRHLHSGKVRDLYELTGGPYAGELLMVASDRISIFDFVLDSTIPDKGELLTRPGPRTVEGAALLCEALDGVRQRRPK